MITTQRVAKCEVLHRTCPLDPLLENSVSGGTSMNVHQRCVEMEKFGFATLKLARERKAIKKVLTMKLGIRHERKKERKIFRRGAQRRSALAHRRCAPLGLSLRWKDCLG